MLLPAFIKTTVKLGLTSRSTVTLLTCSKGKLCDVRCQRVVSCVIGVDGVTQLHDVI